MDFNILKNKENYNKLKLGRTCEKSIDLQMKSINQDQALTFRTMDKYQAMCEISLAIDSRFDTSNYSEYARKFEYNVNALREVMINIANNEMHVYNKQVGGVAEGTVGNWFLSDVDILMIDQKSTVGYRPRETPFLNKTYLRLTNEPSTPAGYTKLQIYRNGKPNKIDNKEFIHCVIRNNGKSYLTNITNTPLTDNGKTINTVNHGPAQTSQFINTSLDNVSAYESRTLPKEIMPWFERKRLYNWPTKETCNLFKSMGCCYVGIGHSKSQEKHLEWRISPTRQELYLMLNLNPTQYRCYIILKLIKMDIIKKECGDMLSSYHCKTALFYTIETNNSDIWQPHNLIKCVLRCLKLLLYWVKQRNCPNYFIPEENMFETKLIGSYKIEKLKRCLGTLTDNSLQTHFKLMHHWKYFIWFQSEKENIWDTAVALKKTLMNASQITQSSICEHIKRVRAIYDKAKSQTEQNIFEEIKRVFPYEPNLDILISVLMENLLHLKIFEQLLSVMRRRINVNKYLDIHKKIPETLPESFQYCLKLASIAMAQKNHVACDKLLQKVRHISYRSFIVCRCDFTGCFPDTTERIYFKTRVIFDQMLAGKCLNCMSIHDIFQQFTLCFKFSNIELEEGVVLAPLHLEAYKTIGKSQNMRVFSKGMNTVKDLISLHPVTYIHFLEYKNSEMMRKKYDMSVALEKLENMNLVSLPEVTYSHPDIILNLLGHIYITKGWYRHAMQCFRRSWQLYPDINSAKWHIMFLLFGSPKQVSKRRLKKTKVKGR